MERDLLVMLYGAIMGVVGSIVTSIVTALFHFWLERREYERRQNEERQGQLKQIYLPTDEEVRTIYLEHQEERHAEPARTFAGAGSLLVSVFLSNLTVYQTHDPISVPLWSMPGIFAHELGHLMLKALEDMNV